MLFEDSIKLYLSKQVTLRAYLPKLQPFLVNKIHQEALEDIQRYLVNLIWLTETACNSFKYTFE